MARFDTCLAFLLSPSIEGGAYSDRPSDRGGPTDSGITQATYNAYRARAGRSAQSVARISSDEISDIYRMGYWKPLCCDSLPVGLDVVVFDSGVNHGVRQATKFLQRALGVDDDGIIGQETMHAVVSDAASGMVDHLIGDILDQRRDFYEHLVEKDPSQRDNFNGWINRLSAVSKEARL